MSEQTSRPRPAGGPAGAALTLDDLPPPNLKRWISRRKAEVVGAVGAGLIGLDEACARYGVTIEEFSVLTAPARRARLARTARHAPEGLFTVRPTGTDRNHRRIARPPNRALRPAALTLDKWPLESRILEAIPRLVGRLTPKRGWST